EPPKHGRRSPRQECGQQHWIADRSRRLRSSLLLILIQLGDPDRSGPNFPPQRSELENRLCGLQALEPLVSHPLGGELLQSGRCGPGRTPGLGIDGKLKPRAESKCPQDSEIVFGKPLCWITYRPDQTAFQVLLAGEGISPLVPKRV